MLGKKDKAPKAGAAQKNTDKVIEKAMESLPATQKWISIDDLRKAAVSVDGSKG